jgi:hypothetical protein
MKRKNVRPLILVGALIAVTCVAMAYSSGGIPTTAVIARHGILKLSGHLDHEGSFRW